MLYSQIILGALILLSFGMYARLHSRAMRARRAQEFLERVDHGGEERDLLDDIGPRYAKHRWLQGILRDMPLTVNLLDLLDGSGESLTVAKLMGQMMMAAGGGFVVAFVFGLEMVVVLVLTGLCGVVPALRIMRKKTQRMVKLEGQLPQALELIGLYLRSGRSLPQAFVGATEELPAPVSQEFFACAEEYRLGRPLDAALKKMARRYQASIGLRLFAIAVTVLGQTGGNLVEVLERIKRTLDANITYVLRLRSMTGEARMSAWILGALPGVFMLLAAASGTGYFAGFTSSHLGHVLLAILLTTWGAGILWVRRLMGSTLA